MVGYFLHKHFLEQLPFIHPHFTNSTTSEGAENKFDSVGMNLPSDICQPNLQGSNLFGLQILSCHQADACN